MSTSKLRMRFRGGLVRLQHWLRRRINTPNGRRRLAYLESHPKTRRVLAIVDLTDRTCGTCRHFDLNRGQAHLRGATLGIPGAFQGAASVATPAELFLDQDSKERSDGDWGSWGGYGQCDKRHCLAASNAPDCGEWA